MRVCVRHVCTIVSPRSVRASKQRAHRGAVQRNIILRTGAQQTTQQHDRIIVLWRGETISLKFVINAERLRAPATEQTIDYCRPKIRLFATGCGSLAGGSRAQGYR